MKKACRFLDENGKCKINPFRRELLFCDYEEGEYCEDFKEK